MSEQQLSRRELFRRAGKAAVGLAAIGITEAILGKDANAQNALPSDYYSDKRNPSLEDMIDTAARGIFDIARSTRVPANAAVTAQVIINTRKDYNDETKEKVGTTMRTNLVVAKPQAGKEGVEFVVRTETGNHALGPVNGLGSVEDIKVKLRELNAKGNLTTENIFGLIQNAPGSVTSRYYGTGLSTALRSSIAKVAALAEGQGIYTVLRVSYPAQSWTGPYPANDLTPPGQRQGDYYITPGTTPTNDERRMAVAQGIYDMATGAKNSVATQLKEYGPQFLKKGTIGETEFRVNARAVLDDGDNEAVVAAGRQFIIGHERNRSAATPTKPEASAIWTIQTDKGLVYIGGIHSKDGQIVSDGLESSEAILKTINEQIAKGRMTDADMERALQSCPGRVTARYYIERAVEVLTGSKEAPNVGQPAYAHMQTLPLADAKQPGVKQLIKGFIYSLVVGEKTKSWTTQLNPPPVVARTGLSLTENEGRKVAPGGVPLAPKAPAPAPAP